MEKTPGTPYAPFWQRQLGPLKYATWAILAAVLVLAFTSLLFTAAPSPSLCGGCHEMRDEYKSWQASSHRNVSCARCHQSPGVLGQGTQRLRLLSMIFANTTGLYRDPVSTRVADDNCLSCHAKVAQKTITAKSIKVRHREIINAGYNCGTCHNRVVHGDAVPIKNTGSMGICITCHNERLGWTDCDYCHKSSTTKAPAFTAWRVAHGPNWRRTHSALDLSLCPTCHTERYCARCHKLEDVPHSENWLTIHGPIASSDKGKCYQCHQKELCEDCHKLPMPHPADWLPKHFNVVKARGEKLCLNCHMRRGCTTCHEEHVHPLAIEKWKNIKERNEKGPWPGL